MPRTAKRTTKEPARIWLPLFQAGPYDEAYWLAVEHLRGQGFEVLVSAPSMQLRLVSVPLGDVERAWEILRSDAVLAAQLGDGVPPRMSPLDGPLPGGPASAPPPQPPEPPRVW